MLNYDPRFEASPSNRGSNILAQIPKKEPRKSRNSTK
jgi:hypothetical protein